VERKVRVPNEKKGHATIQKFKRILKSAPGVYKTSQKRKGCSKPFRKKNHSRIGGNHG